MTKNEAIMIINYALAIYPNVKMTEEQVNNNALIWESELHDKSCEIVSAAFKLARIESPTFMPTVPEIQQAIRYIEMKARFKSDEQEFMDSHCGKTREEWKQMKDWEASAEGKEKIESYKLKLKQLFVRSAS